jgi:hypothetical protein
MRLSALVIVIVGILLFSLTVTAAPAGSSTSTGSSASSASSSASHGSSSASSGSSASVHSSSSPAFHAASSGHSAGMGATSPSKGVPSFKVPSPEEKAANEKQTRGFWHPFRKAEPVHKAEFHFPVKCVKEPCAVCPPGSRHGACVVANNFCPAGQSWNALGCSPQYLFADCSALARQLEAQRRQMRGRSDPGQSLIYQTLLSQYQQCMERYGLRSIGSFAFNERMSDLMP